MKRFVSLSAALLLGTVLSKEHGHIAKAITKANKHKKEEAIVPKKESVESNQEYEVQIKNWEDLSEEVRNAQDSPKTSVDTSKTSEQDEKKDETSVSPGVNQWPIPKPKPKPKPLPNPNNWPVPNPKPNPNPKPWPIPIPQPQPDPNPQPWPFPIPQPEPEDNNNDPWPFPFPKPPQAKAKHHKVKKTAIPDPLPRNFCKKMYKTTLFNERTGRWDDDAIVCDHCGDGSRPCTLYWKNDYSKKVNHNETKWVPIPREQLPEPDMSPISYDDYIDNKVQNIFNPTVCTACALDKAANMIYCQSGATRVPQYQCDEFNLVQN